VDEIRCAVVGYGAAFHQGRSHARQIRETPGLRLTAVCDLDPARVEAAKADFPDIAGYTDLERMVADGVADLAAIVVPHRHHAPAALTCLRGGLHVVLEKPMALTVAECTALIEEARARGRMLTVYHNRRADGDFSTLRGLLRDGVIGQVFHIEYYGGGYGRPGGGWRADKAISGGAFYDWGAHIVDWVLGLMEERMVAVTGFFHKRVWHDVTNEDQVQAVIRFAGGQVADVQQSHISLGPKARWRILGTEGAILDRGDRVRVGQGERGAFLVRIRVHGYPAEFQVPYRDPVPASFYARVQAHLARGEPLPVTPESARRVIAVLELAERSSASGRSEPVPYEEAWTGPHCTWPYA
jgi:scyllo-inositol 2-dehydrogenase (NADP+)